MHRSSFLTRATLHAIPLFSFALFACGGAPGSGTESSSAELSSSGTTPSPSPTPVPSPTPPSICKGPLPKICEVCSDGKAECAHWVVEGGKCEVAICGPSATPPPSPSPVPVTTPPSATPPITSLCPVGEKPCEVLDTSATTCETECVKDTYLCIAPPACHPICDPPGPAPEKDCTWSLSACKWLCASATP